MRRIIGLTHRVKRTAEGEARPTMVAIFSDGKLQEEYKLETETDELNFVLGRFGTKFAPAEEGVTLQMLREQGFLERELQIAYGKKDVVEAIKVPTTFDGFQAGDIIAMTLGGSGDRLAYALARRAHEIGSTVLRLPPAILKDRRGTDKAVDKEKDHLLLAEIATQEPKLFQDIAPRDLPLIEVREAYRTRMDAQKARLACEQRLRQRLIGNIFLSPEGKYPEGRVEDEFDELKASDAIYLALCKEEGKREGELKKLVHKLSVWKEIFEPIEGVGEIITARLLTAIGDIGRFIPDDASAEITELRSAAKEALRQSGLTLDENGHVECLEGLDWFHSLGAYSKTAHEKVRESNDPTDLARAQALQRAIELYRGIHELKRSKQARGPAKLKRFCGVFVLPDGRFPRRRHGEVANWHPDARQALYLLGDQFCKRPGSVWGIKLREYKKKLREKYPEPISMALLDDKGEPKLTKLGKPMTVKRYTDGHIHKMATWKTLSKFLEWLYWEWTELERRDRKVAPTTDASEAAA